MESYDDGEQLDREANSTIFHQTQTKIDVSTRQNASLKQERFNAVLPFSLFAEYLSHHFVHGNFQNESSSSNQSCTSFHSFFARPRNLFFFPSAPTSTSTTSSSPSSSTANSAYLLGRLFRRQSWLSRSEVVDEPVA